MSDPDPFEKETNELNFSESNKIFLVHEGNPLPCLVCGHKRFNNIAKMYIQCEKCGVLYEARIT